MRFRVRASSDRFVGGASPAWLSSLLALSLLSGCQKQEEISRYTVKKMPAIERPEKTPTTPRPPMQPAGHGMATSERMLGAIAAKGRTLWIFKVAGAKDTVADQMPQFLSLIQSLKFGDDEAQPPEWTLPEGWTEKKEDNPKSMRFTTLLVKTDRDELPLTVLRLPVPKEQPIDRMPLMIVNMWCDQLGLAEKSPADLKAEEQPKDAEVRQLEVSGQNVTLVNFLAAANPVSSKPNQPVTAQGVPQWKVPEGWKTDRGNEFSLAAFAVADGERAIKITVSRAGGDLRQNLNRWRGQLGLPQWSQDEMEKSAKRLKVDGHDGTSVDLVGNDQRTQKPSCTLGVIVPRDGEAWFFKLTGDVELAKREKENFESFVLSVKFEQ